MTGKNKLILLVEDIEQIMEGNRRMLERQGYDVAAALTLHDARACMRAQIPDAIVLDIMLPDGSGLDFISELRSGKNSGIPVLLLTGLTTKEDVVYGLKAGGDDYLTKPYDFSELLARVEALLRRAARVPETIVNGALTLDPLAGQAFMNGEDLLLAQKEFALLLLFVQHESKILSAEYVYEKVWGTVTAGDKNTLQATISKLRKKIALSGHDVTTLRGQGYIFE